MWAGFSEMDANVRRRQQQFARYVACAASLYKKHLQGRDQRNEADDCDPGKPRAMVPEANNFGETAWKCQRA
jgi:hypothetical protein